jgi:hypothetical protein
MGNACIIINNDITNTVIIIIFTILENVLDRCQDSIINISIITSISVIDNDITIYIKIKIKCDIIADPVCLCVLYYDVILDVAFELYYIHHMTAN